MNHSEIQIPSSALDFYIKLYCRKRKENKSKLNNVISEATKSWLTLSKCEKHHFNTKYEQIKSNIKKQLANQLKNAVPYLKKKVVPVQRATIESQTNEDVIEGNNIILDGIDQTAPGQSILLNNEENKAETRFGEENNDIVTEIPTQEQSNVNLYDNNYNTPLTEPIPPKLLTGEQLFNMVNENKTNLSWTTLTITERRKYQNAVLAIKRNYLKDYRRYLEQLPSENLHKYYVNNVSSVL